MHPNKRNFVEGVDLLLTAWPALHVAVRNEFGGPESAEKRRWLVDAVVEHFDAEGKSVETLDLEDILLGVMSREFCTILEDGSQIAVARDLFHLYRDCIKGSTVVLERIRQQAIRAEDVQVLCAQSSDSDVVAEEGEEFGEDSEDMSCDDAE